MIDKKKFIDDNTPRIRVIPDVEKIGEWSITLLLFPRAEHSCIHIKGPKPNDVVSINVNTQPGWSMPIPLNQTDVIDAADGWLNALREVARERS